MTTIDLTPRRGAPPRECMRAFCYDGEWMFVDNTGDPDRWWPHWAWHIPLPNTDDLPAPPALPPRPEQRSGTYDGKPCWATRWTTNGGTGWIVQVAGECHHLSDGENYPWGNDGKLHLDPPEATR